MPVNLGTKETQTLRTLCWLSINRMNLFQMRENGSTPDIYVVDREDPASMQAYADLNALHPAPVVYLLAEDAPSGVGQVSRPMLPRQLLAALDDAIDRWEGFAETVVSKIFHDDTAAIFGGG